MKKLIISVMLAAVCCCSVTAHGIAATETNSGGFSIKAVIPDNQIDTNQSYFDLKAQPGQTQTLEVIISNSRDEDFNAQIALNPAITGRNGVIVYTEPDGDISHDAPSISDIAALKADRVIVPPRSKKSAYIDITIPEKPIDGVILGGISVTDGGTGSTQEQAEGLSLTNKITYVIAVKLTGNESEKPADFDLTSVKPELVNFQPAVVTTLENKAPLIVKNMAVHAQVMRKSSDEVLHEYSNSVAEMAPLSRGAFVIDWENSPLERGDYRLKMTADYDGRTWVWEEEFTIGGEAVEINGGAVGMKHDYSWLYVLFGAALLTLVWFIAFYFGRRKKKTSENA